MPDLDTPSLVVGQMPVKTVEFVERQYVDERFDLVNREEMTAAVEHGAAISETRFILHMHCRKSHAILRDKLTQALQSVEESRRGTARHGDTPLADVERIGLRPERRIDPEYDAAFGNSGNFQPKSMFSANIPHEEFRDTPQRFSPAGYSDPRSGGEHRSFASCVSDVLRHGNDRGRICRSGFRK